MDPVAVLRCFGDIAERRAAAGRDEPHGTLPLDVLDVARSRSPLAWLGTAVGLPLPTGARPPVLPATDTVRRLAALDALSPTGPQLRLGWVVVAGHVTVADRHVGYCFPLLAQPVRLERPPEGAAHLHLRPTGEPELTPLVADADRGAGLEESPQFGGGALDPAAGDVTARRLARLPRLLSWIREVVAACGLPPVTDILPPGEDPRSHRSRVGLVACVGSLLHLAPEAPAAPSPAALRAWADARGLAGTAFGAVYGPAQPPAPAVPAEPLDAPLALTSAQREAAQRPRTEVLTVVSGPPGSGKSHTAAAIAADAVSRGLSVLLAAGSRAGADTLTRLLAARHGPEPLPVGRPAASGVAARLAGGGTTSAELRAAEHTLAEARAHQRMLERAITEQLAREQAADADRWETLLPQLRTAAPRALDPGADPGRLAALLERAQGQGHGHGGRWGRVEARLAEAWLRTLVRAGPSTPLSELALAVRAAQDRRGAAELAAAGGTTLVRSYAELAEADDEVLAAAGRVAAARAESEQRRRRRSAGLDLVALVHAGRRRRRTLLQAVDGPAMTAALPLWVGTVAEIDDLLPPVAGLFDLVVVDEAHRIDQVAAAGTLLRGRRAVVVGDPRQLPPARVLDDETMRATLAEHGLEPHASRLDLGRASLFDVAAATTAVSWLDEHVDAVPQLVEFPARRFYEGRVSVATRHPVHESAHAVEIVHVDADPGLGPGGSGDLVERQVAVALDRVASLGARGRSGIVVVSPLEDVAEALRAEALARFDLDDVGRLGLRIGTVSGTQGTRADAVVLVVGLVPGDPPGLHHAVEEPHRFNVMVTRARRELVVVTALPPPAVGTPAGLIDAFLAGVSRPPRSRRRPPPPRSPWVSALAEELRSHGLAVQAPYTVGRWSVDLCAGAGDDAIAVETAVHPEGPEAHVERQRALRRAGWRTVDGFPSRWQGDAASAAVDITKALRA